MKSTDKNFINFQNLVSQITIKNIVVILDFNKSNRNQVMQNIKKEINMKQHMKNTTSRIIENSNSLSPEMTISQNIRFFEILNNCKLKEQIKDSSFFYKTSKYLHKRRGEIDESIWQAIGLILFFKQNYKYYLVNASMGPALKNHELGEDLTNIILEVSKTKKIYIYSNPPSIEIFKKISNNYTVINDCNYSSMLLYDEARKYIHEYKKRKNRNA